MIVAIDGTSGSGKSTLASFLAQKLNFKHINGGAFYRAIAFQFDMMGFKEIKIKSLKQVLKSCTLEVKYVKNKQHTILNGKDVSSKIYASKYSTLASNISPFKIVRQFVKKIERSTYKIYNNIVIEGRDACTVVFPKAQVKIFLTASAEVRAERRLKDLKEKGETNLSYQDVLKMILKRDRVDKTRKLSPLKIAKGALVIDSSNKTIDEVVELVLNEVNKKR